MKWYARDPHRAIEGMIGLTLEERGAYNTLIDHAYARDGDLPDDPHLIGVMLGVHGHTWRSVRRRLIEKGKITILDGRIIPNGVEATMKSAANVRQKSRKPSKIKETTPEPAGFAPPAAAPPDSAAKPRQNPGIIAANSRQTSGKNPENPMISTRAGAPDSTNTNTNTTIIESDRSSVVQLSPARRDLAHLETQLREAAGWQNEPAPNLCVVGPIAALLDAGADLELDVLPTLRARGPNVRNRRSWAYFLEPIAEARDRRRAAGNLTTTKLTPGDLNGTPRPLTNRQRNFAILDAIADEMERRENQERDRNAG